MKEKEANSWMLNIIPGNCPVLRPDIVFFRSWDMQVLQGEVSPLPNPQPGGPGLRIYDSVA